MFDWSKLEKKVKLIFSITIYLTEESLKLTMVNTFNCVMFIFYVFANFLIQMQKNDNDRKQGKKSVSVLLVSGPNGYKHEQDSHIAAGGTGKALHSSSLAPRTVGHCRLCTILLDCILPVVTLLKLNLADLDQKINKHLSSHDVIYHTECEVAVS